jgi:hypothetical protein
MNRVSYELATPDVVGEKFQEGMVILNLESGKYFDVNDPLHQLLTALESGISIEAIQVGLDQHSQGLGLLAQEAIVKMNAFGLLRETAASSDKVSHELIQKITANATLTDTTTTFATIFNIDSHDDLVELIASDPVHDVDPETGRVKA